MMKRIAKVRTDFISDLPPSILHHILSFLGSEDSVRTSVLSKKWNSVQKSFPILQFMPPVDVWESSPRFKERLREFLYSVDRSLLNFAEDQLCIERLDLRVARVNQFSLPLVNSWLPLVFLNGVSDLRFNVSIDDGNDSYLNYPLPETAFTVNSSVSGSSEFFLLKKLNLASVILTEKIVQDIIGNCRNLVDFNLSEFSGLKTLNISKPAKLATLTVFVTDNTEELTSVFADAHSLQRVSLDMYYTSHAIDLTSCCNLRELDLRTSPITDAQFNLNISRFPLLEVLKVVDCNSLRAVRISLQRLKLLSLEYCEFDSIAIDAPVLSEFRYVVTTERIEELPVFYLSNAIPGSMYISYNTENASLIIDSVWLRRIREYLNVPFKSINLDIGPQNNLASHSAHSHITFDPYELVEHVIPPEVQIDCLCLNALVLEDPSHWEILLEGLLWSCHPKTVLMTADFSIENNCVQTLCTMLNQIECQFCSSWPHCECWRRCLKAATIESTGDIEFHAINVRSVSEVRVQCGIPKGNLFSNPKRCSVTFRFEWRNPA